MTNFIKEQVAVLIELQSLENKTRTLQSALNGVEPQLKELDQRLSESEKISQHNEADLEMLRKAYRDHEREVQNHRSRIEKSIEKSRSVKTNKEYQTILKEIDDFKAKASDIEDEMLKILDRIDTAEADLEQQRKEFDCLRAEVTAEKETIQNDAQQKQAALKRLAEERLAVEARLTPEMLTRFRNVKAKTGGVGISAVKQAVCQGCHVNIPPQFFNELQRYETLVQCPNCQRIIYYYDPNQLR